MTHHPWGAEQSGGHVLAFLCANTLKCQLNTVWEICCMLDTCNKMPTNPSWKINMLLLLLVIGQDIAIPFIYIFSFFWLLVKKLISAQLQAFNLNNALQPEQFWFHFSFVDHYLHSEPLVFLPTTPPNYCSSKNKPICFVACFVCVIIFHGHARELSQATEKADKWAIYLIQ